MVWHPSGRARSMLLLAGCVGLIGLSECGGDDRQSAGHAGGANAGAGGGAAGATSTAGNAGTTGNAGIAGDAAAGDGHEGGAAGQSPGGSTGRGAAGEAGTLGTAAGAGAAGAAATAGAAGAPGDCAVLGVPGTCRAAADCMNTVSPTSAECSGAAGSVCCTPYGEALCDPAATPRPDPNAGNTLEAPGEAGCPAGMVVVGTFCVDQYEATLVRVADGSTWCPFDNPGTTAVRALSVANSVPQAYIDAAQAADACSNAGKRLCTDAEWLRACQGPGGHTYPYGNTREPGTCNDHRAQHPAVEYFGTTDSAIYSELDNSCLDQLPESVDRTGSLARCATAEGAFDMMGNLHEWTADPAGTFRGGSYVDTTLNGNGCLYATTAHDAQYWDYSTGFRCCAD